MLPSMSFHLLLIGLLPTQPATQPAPIEPLALNARSAPIAAPEEFPAMEYTYAELSYVWLDSDAVDDTLDGWDLTGSFELPMNFFLQGTVRQLSGDVDFNTYKIGVGWHFGLVPRLDAYGILSYESVELDGFGSSADEDGPAAEVGLRFSLLKALEVNGRLLWSDLDESDSGGGLGARWYFSDMLSAGLNVDSFASDTIGTVGVRVEL
jgi:hypothetical protein